MAATVSSVWAKPGAWALDSEQHEDELKQEIHHQDHQFPEPPAVDFPSLAAAATAKPKKKNKPKTLSLAAFSTYASDPNPKPAAESQRLTQDELLMLPTGPRERTAEELERNRLGGGFRNYGGGIGDSARPRVSDRNWEREGYNGNSNRERDMGPSRADEVDDWSKAKRFGSSTGPERREKVGFFNSSRADEVDNWASKKSFPALSEVPRRERRMGFESYSNGSGPDSDNWLKKKEKESERRMGFESYSNGSGPDSDNWLKEERESIGSNGNGNGRPRLNLQPRTLPVVNNGQSQTVGEGKPKGANPFGEARPREEVLAEKGKDWKEIDEKLEALKVKDVEVGGEKGEGRRRGFGMGRSGSGDQRTVRSWRKPESVESDSLPPLSSEVAEKTDKTEDVAEES